MKEQLKECPFCAAAAAFVKHSAGMPETMGFDQWDAVACKGCGATVGASDRRFRNPDDAAKAWNQRVAVVSPIVEAQLAELRAQVAELRAKVPVWQPIETAPKGKNGISFMQVAYGSEEDQKVNIAVQIDGNFYAGGIFYCLGNKEKPFEIRETTVQPTHWQPLPAAPVEEQEVSRGTC